MKKILAMLLALMMVLSLAACGSSTPAEEPAEAPEADAPEAEAPAEGGVLTMATNAYFPPYEYYENDQIIGIDVEVAAKIAEKLGMELQVEDMDFGSILAAVQTGKCDMGMAGITVTPERMESVNFSDFYATGVQVVIVKDGGSVASLDDLAGKKIGVQENTTGDIYCTDEFGEDCVERFVSGNAAVLALVQGKIDAVVIDNEPAKNYVAANEGLSILDTEYAVEDYAIVISKDNDELLEKVNAALAELEADGTLAEIVAKYIPAAAEEAPAEEAPAEDFPVDDGPEK